MYNNPYSSSLETKILSATPMELVKLLYQSAIEAVQSARHHLCLGEIVERGRSVSKAVEIVAELSGSLDHERGGELSTNLAALYDYLQRTLLDANFRQADDGLARTETLLKTLSEAWSTIETLRPTNALELHQAPYGLAGTAIKTDEYAGRVSQQWCA
jgi:flagellar protein FliS